jgi:hypothetical protein
MLTSWIVAWNPLTAPEKHPSWLTVAGFADKSN